MARAPGRPPKLKRMSLRQAETYERVLHAVNLSRRHGIPLDVAAREARTTVKSVLRYAQPAVKRVGGAWMARTSDRLERRMLLYDQKGSYHAVVDSSEAASLIGDYHNAVGRFLEKGDDSKLRFFEGKYVTDVDGRRHRFLTDRDAIKRLARAGQFGFESIY